MAIDLTSFTKQLTIFAVLLFLFYGLFSLWIPDRFTPQFYWAIGPFFYVLVMLSKYLLVLLTGKKNNSFDLNFISITVIRFLLYVGVLLLYAFLFPEDAIVFIITFFVFYFAFTLFEVVFIYRDFKEKQTGP